MFRVAIALAVIGLTPSAWAGPEIFAGQWEGKGSYIYKGDITLCSTMEMTFSAGPNKFSFVSGRRVCEKHSEAFYPVNMTFRNGELLFNGQVVGKYDGNTLEAYYRMPDGTSYRNWRMSMRREGDHLMYEESRTMEGEDTPLISFAGTLKLK